MLTNQFYRELHLRGILIDSHLIDQRHDIAQILIENFRYHYNCYLALRDQL
jgi:hypothetical protein